MNGIQEARGSNPLISTLARESAYPRFRKGARFCCMLCFTHVHAEAELLKVNIKINVQLVVPVNLDPVD